MIDESVRTLIREVLAEELQRLKTEKTGARNGVREESVSIGTDAELTAFVATLMKLASDPKARREIEQGGRVFRLAGSTAPAARGPAPASAAASAATPAQSGDTVRMETGMVSERQVDALPRGTRTLVAGKDVKLTPLARDRLRQRGIKLERTG